jgi:hypothetical protein
MKRSIIDSCTQNLANVASDTSTTPYSAVEEVPMFYHIGADAIGHIFSYMDYSSVLTVRSTSKSMYTIGTRWLSRTEAEVKQAALMRIRADLTQSNLLPKFEELMKTYNLVLGGDYVLFKLLDDNKPKADLHIYISAHRTSKAKIEQDLRVCFADGYQYDMENWVDWEQPILAFSYKANHSIVTLFFHLTMASCLPNYIEKNFDLSCSKICTDLKQIYTERFWQQRARIGYVDSWRNTVKTGYRIESFMDEYGFHIHNPEEFPWQVLTFNSDSEPTARDMNDSSNEDQHLRVAKREEDWPPYWDDQSDD